MKMENEKSCGPEGIYAELLKSETSKLYRTLTRIINECLNSHETPRVENGIYISIFKKGVNSDYQNYRGISVTDTMSRLYGRILRELIEKEITDEEERSGFRGGQSCTVNVFIMKQIIEKRSAVNLKTHILFIDLKKAYDNIPIDKLRVWEVLPQTNLNQSVITAIKNLYAHSAARVKIGNKLSPPPYITKGLRQGCCISPTLFKIYIKEALLKWKKKCSGIGIPLADRTIYSL